METEKLKEEFIKAEFADLRESYPHLTEQAVREAFEKVVERNEEPANAIEMFTQRHWKRLQDEE